MHTALFAKALVAWVMVDGEVDARFEHLGVVGEQAQRGEVDGDDRLIVKIVRDPILLDIGLEVLGRLAVIEDARGLTHLAQHGAQRRSAAERVAVGAAVGQDQVAVMRAQKGGDLLDRHSSSPSSTICSFAGFAGFTTRTSRSISKMCAPYSMESSAMNCNSGV